MIRIHIRDADGRLSEVLRTEDPVAAEAYYLCLCSRRTVSPAALIVDPGPTLSVPAGRYRLDRGWPADVHREGADERRSLQWESGAPTPAMVRALGVVAELTGARAAQLCGVSAGRVWRRWIGGEREMPIAAYWWLLVVTGLHPEFVARGAGKD